MAGPYGTTLCNECHLGEEFAKYEQAKILADEAKARENAIKYEAEMAELLANSDWEW